MVKMHTMYEIDLTDEESEAFTDAWEEEGYGLPDDPLIIRKKDLNNFFIDFIDEGEEEGLPEYMEELLPQLKLVRKKVNMFHDECWLLIALGL